MSVKKVSSDSSKQNLRVDDILVVGRRTVTRELIATDLVATNATIQDQLSLNGIPNEKTTNILYYNDVTKTVSYDVAPEGGTSTLSRENLVFSDSKTSTISTNTDVTNIITYDYTSPNAGVLADISESGKLKYLILDNPLVAPVQVSIKQGNFLLSNPSQPRTTLLSQKDNGYIQLSGPNLTWFPKNQQGSKLVGSSVIGSSSLQGSSVSLSSDGNTLAIGAFNDDNGVGSVWIFNRNPVTSIWSQTAKLVSSGTSPLSGCGVSVSLSADGRTLAIGGPGTSSDVGAVWVWTFDGTIWTQQTKIVPTTPLGQPLFGTSLDLSADGNTLAIGGPFDNPNGATWIYVRSSGSWSFQTKLISVSTFLQGNSVALSANGNILAVGAKGDTLLQGAVFIWRRSFQTGSPVWSQAQKISGSLPIIEFGTSVDISASGNTLVVGAPVFSSSKGSGFVYELNESGQFELQAQLIGSDSTTFSEIGQSVTISSDGNTIAIGGDSDDSGQGATWIFSRISGQWFQQGNKLIGTGGSTDAAQGTSVSLSSSGATLAVGGVNDDSTIGATWIFN